MPLPRNKPPKNSYDEWGETQIEQGYIMDWPVVPGTNIKIHEGSHVLVDGGKIVKLYRLIRGNRFSFAPDMPIDQEFTGSVVNNSRRENCVVKVSEILAFIPKEKVQKVAGKIQGRHVTMDPLPSLSDVAARDNFKYKFNEGKLLEELKKYIHQTYGEHYAGEGKVQALELIIDSGNGKGFLIGDIIKYAARYTKKGQTPAEWRKDLIKTAHYAILMLAAHDKEYPELRTANGTYETLPDIRA